MIGNIKPKPLVEVCLLPEILYLFNTEESIVVIIDVLRATSTITMALFNGAKEIIPVATIEECMKRGKMPNSVMAGERNGAVASGMEYGNSPLTYHRNFIQGKTLVLTTTNGTALIEKSKSAKQIVIGSFLNFSILCNYLIQQQQPIILACAGWKGNVNVEDTLFAGAVANRLKRFFDITADATIIAETLYLKYKGNRMMDLIKKSSHYKRLSNLGIHDDIDFCMSMDKAPILPIYNEGKIVAG